MRVNIAAFSILLCCLWCTDTFAQESDEKSLSSWEIALGMEPITVTSAKRNFNNSGDLRDLNHLPSTVRELYMPSLLIGHRRSNAKGRERRLFLQLAYFKGKKGLDFFKNGYEAPHKYIYQGEKPFSGSSQFRNYSRIESKLGYGCVLPVFQEGKKLSGHLGIDLRAYWRQIQYLDFSFFDHDIRKEVIENHIGLGLQVRGELRWRATQKGSLFLSAASDYFFYQKEITARSPAERPESLQVLGRSSLNFFPEALRLGWKFDMNAQPTLTQTIDQQSRNHIQINIGAVTFPKTTVFENTNYPQDSFVVEEPYRHDTALRTMLNYRHATGQVSYWQFGVGGAFASRTQTIKRGTINEENFDNFDNVDQLIDGNSSTLGEVNYRHFKVQAGPVWQLTKKFQINAGLLANADFIQQELYHWNPIQATAIKGKREKTFLSLEAMIDLMYVIKGRVGIGLSAYHPVVGHNFEKSNTATGIGRFENVRFSRKRFVPDLRLSLAYYFGPH